MPPQPDVIYLWVRPTLDWAVEEAALARITGSFRPKVDVWNATFTMSYQRFRFRLAQIAARNHALIDGAVRAPEDEIPDGAVVLPVDDDDWFAPFAARRLEQELPPDCRGWVWPSRWLEVPIDLHRRLGLIRRRLIPSTPMMWICTTNNYAVRKSPTTGPLLTSHMEASRWFEQHLARADGEGHVRQLDTPLSVTNRNLASQTALGQSKPTITRATLLRKFHRYRRLYHRPLPPELAWCEPYVASMADLMADLTVKGAAG